MSDVEPFADVDLPLPDRRAGKVRVSWALPENRRLFVTTDRLSAFDRVVAVVPYKGQVLNQLSAWWFESTRDVVDNHFLSAPDPNATVARAATPLPVEVVVRATLTGSTSTSLWRLYERGERTIYGHRIPDGMRRHEMLPAPIVTPTTKAADGGHDEPVDIDEVWRRGLVERSLWGRVTEAALALFDRGSQVATAAGLVLVDTKYEFGLDARGELMLIDEVHTPDSSRYWVAETLEGRLAAGGEPESLDKEPVRLALAATGWRGDGEPPTLESSVVSDTTARYVRTYERLTGEAFVPGDYPVGPRLEAALTRAKLW